MEKKIREVLERVFFDDERPLKGERAIKELLVEGDLVRVSLGVDPVNGAMERFEMEDRLRDAVRGIEGVGRVVVSSSSLFESSKGAAPRPRSESKKAAPELPPKKVLHGVKHVILVCSAKGGVGKSTVALNTALALHQAGKQVGLLDLDLYGPSIPTLVGSDLTPVIIGEKIYAPEIHGLSVLSIGMMMGESQPLIWRGPMVASVINQLLFEVDWSGLDYLIVDMPPGTGDSYLSVLQSIEIDGVIIVTTPSELALADVRRGVGLFDPFAVKIIGVVENMASYAWPRAQDALDTIHSIAATNELMASKLKRLVELVEESKEQRIFGSNTDKHLKALNLSLLASLPLDPELQNRNDSGKPYMLEPERAEIQRAFMKIAQKLLEL